MLAFYIFVALMSLASILAVVDVIWSHRVLVLRRRMMWRLRERDETIDLLHAEIESLKRSHSKAVKKLEYDRDHAYDLGKKAGENAVKEMKAQAINSLQHRVRLMQRYISHPVMSLIEAELNKTGVVQQSTRVIADNREVPGWLDSEEN